MTKLGGRWRIRLVAPIALGMTQVASAQAFQPSEMYSITANPAGVDYSGKIGEATYSYIVDLNDKVIRGSVDGPLPSNGNLTDDPDRWVVMVNTDEMTDVTRWYLTHYQTGLMLRMSQGGAVTSACVINADFPGRPIAIRVGERPAIQMSKDCLTPPLALKAGLLAGGRLLVRGYEWPYDVPVDKSGSASTFAAAYKLYMFLRQRR